MTSLRAHQASDLSLAAVISAFAVLIQRAQTGGADPGAGHVDIYALVARAVAP